MKNSIKYIICSILIILSIICFYYYLKYKDIKIEENIYDKYWYWYNNKDGTYSSIFFSNDKIIFNDSNIENNLCTNYEYNKKNKIFYLDCNVTIEIININDDNIILNINGVKKVFYDTLDNTLNTEFSSYFSKSISDFKKESFNTFSLIKIDYKNIDNIIKENNSSKFIFIGNRCTSIECVISSIIVERWMSYSNNVYYIDSNSINDNMIFNSITESEYNSNYPLVVVTDSNKDLKKYFIKCDGFNCEKYYND